MNRTKLFQSLFWWFFKTSVWDTAASVQVAIIGIIEITSIFVQHSTEGDAPRGTSKRGHSINGRGNFKSGFQIRIQTGTIGRVNGWENKFESIEWPRLVHRHILAHMHRHTHTFIGQDRGSRSTTSTELHNYVFKIINVSTPEPALTLCSAIIYRHFSTRKRSWARCVI